MEGSDLDLTETLGIYSKAINPKLEEILADITPRSLYEASMHLISAGGKKIRPTLALLSCQAVGGEIEDAMNVAVAIELIHTFSLIHDDIMDKDEMRRGEPSVHVLWGEPMAILAGDILFSKAFESTLKTKIDEISYKHVTDALSTIIDSCIKICEGQALDMDFEENFNVKEEEYLEMVYKKTAALISAATKSGAIMGGGTLEEVEALGEYGKLIGLAFQIHDDYLDITGDEKTLGKPVGSDIAEGKMTILTVKTLEKASEEDKEKLIRILKNGNQKGIKEAIKIFKKYDSINYAQRLAQEYTKRAKEKLKILEDSKAKKHLEEIADFIIERKH
ncbi:MAG TPA: short chain isoprenyl diphosphate synthase IdsA [Methanothermobacter sp.]|nr:short chain isoprenyl diphosphate synthase IdsA [Methanothermobacter sp.]HOL69177.1 short chain isoprenyl diphosphate synthase IdsA [Methanothermobacter sp.]HPQ03907.1 short chain isoprenyl diphosphate synthase IdsA [Methanothermobacter sp.]HPU37499.1 short chain isoprenyl diphosphate synthase IdsA [Methanothermobacter sp.]